MSETTLPTPAPTSMTWHIHGCTIRIDEDGAHLTTPERSFEQPEAIAILDLYQRVKNALDHGATIPLPVPPTADQLRDWVSSDRELYAAKRAKRAIDAEFLPATPQSSPF